MGIAFTQIADNRFMSGTKAELQLALDNRVQQITNKLKQFAGVKLSCGSPRFLTWRAKGLEKEHFQWRVDLYLVKPRSIKWDDVYGAINQVSAVHYAKISDSHIMNMMEGSTILLS